MSFPVPIRRGNLYNVVDLSVNLPPTTKRNQHATRPFLVVSNDTQNADPTWLTVTGFPLSHNDAYTTQYDVELQKGQGGLPKKSWVQVDMLQPLAKKDLLSWIGVLDANSVEACIANVLEYIGLD